MGKKCGEEGSWKSNLIPDVWPCIGPSIDSAKFYKACEEHDDCYETLGKSKEECDRAFYNNLKEECDRAFNTLLEVACNGQCKTAALAYFLAVKQAGGDAYRKAQEQARENANIADSKTYLFLLKESTGDVHIHKMRPDGTVNMSKTFDDEWTHHWTTANFFSA
ncbi:MAG: hypothetical protein DWQ04_06525 [Chloroflexi bacterium]|nr:MAG: hypothetical protein DWQ04_06525 [Chloroflexota bacterium]